MLIARVPARRLPSLGKNHACREIALGYFTAKSIDTRRYGLHLVACKSCEDELILLNNHSVRGVQVLWCVPPGLTRVLGWSDPRAPGTVRPHLPSFCRVVSPHMGTCGLGEQVVWVFVTGGAVLCIRSFHPPQGGTQHPPPLTTEPTQNKIRARLDHLRALHVDRGQRVASPHPRRGVPGVVLWLGVCAAARKDCNNRRDRSRGVFWKKLCGAIVGVISNIFWGWWGC